MAKGDCFEVAALMALENSELTLVHGLPTGQGPIEGKVHTHAWTEINGMVLDFSSDKKTLMSAKRYYEIGKIEVTRKYTQKEAREWMVKAEHYGPWELPEDID